MSDNNHIEELIIRYLLKEITEQELHELEAWLEEVPENKATFFRMKNISDTIQRPTFSEIERDESWLRMYGKMRNQNSYSTHKPGVEKKITRLPVFLRYAAVLALTFGIGWGAGKWINSIHETETIQSTPIYNEINVARGGHGNSIILSDGTKVTLNTATKFRYPTGFRGKERTVYLDGEAFFEVAKDESKPFVVKLKKQDITVLGTSFNVEAYGEETYSVVTLSEGSISLEVYNEQGETMNRMLMKPGQQAISDNHSGSVSIKNINTSLTEAWINGEFKFKDEPLLSVTKRLERYFNITINIENESLKQMLFTGTFSLNQDIGEVMNIINEEKRYKVNKVGQEYFITKNKSYNP